jgi:hypothetical protein
VKNAYPVLRGTSDYRYVEYDSALLFLEIGRLNDTRSAITTSLA